MSFLNGVFLGDARKAYSGPITVSTDGLLVTLTGNQHDHAAQSALTRGVVCGVRDRSAPRAPDEHRTARVAGEIERHGRQRLS